MTTTQIINAINTFDPDFNMIDNSQERSFHRSLNVEINNAISTLTPAQAKEVYAELKEWQKQCSHGQMLLELCVKSTTTTKDEKKVSLFNNAWSMFKAGLFTSFAQALKAAWSRVKVVTRMKTGVVAFEYIKSDGTIRLAKGTLTGLDYTAKTTESKPKSNTNKQLTSVFKSGEILKMQMSTEITLKQAQDYVLDPSNPKKYRDKIADLMRRYNNALKTYPAERLLMIVDRLGRVALWLD